MLKKYSIFIYISILFLNAHQALIFLSNLENYNFQEGV